MLLFIKHLIFLLVILEEVNGSKRVSKKKNEKVPNRQALNVCLPKNDIKCPENHFIKILLPNCQKYFLNRNFGIRCRTKLAIIKEASEQCNGFDKCFFKLSTFHLIKCKTFFRKKAKTHYKCVNKKEYNARDEFDDAELESFPNSTAPITTVVTKGDIKTASENTVVPTSVSTPSTEVISKPKDQIISIYRNQTRSFKNSAVTKSGITKVSETSYKETNVIITYRNNSFNKSSQDLMRFICMSNTNAIPDGNYEYKQIPQCYVQCSNGRSKLLCCEKGYKFVSLCNKCRPMNSSDEQMNCNNKHATITPTSVLKSGNDSSLTQYSKTKMDLIKTPLVTTLNPALIDPNEKIRSLLKVNRQNISTTSTLSSFNEILYEAKNKKISINATIYNEFIETSLDKSKSISNVEVIENFVEAFDVFTSSKYTNLNSYNSDKLLSSMDRFGRQVVLPKNKTSLKVIRTTLEFAAERIDKNKSIVFKTMKNKDEQLSINISSSVFSLALDTQQMYFYNYYNTKFFQSENRVLTNVIAATVPYKEISNLAEEITILFPMTKKLKKVENLTCVYWEPMPGLNYSGRWLSNGCRRVDHDREDFVTCKCNHLTNYGLIGNLAVVINPSQTVENLKELEFISFFGCFLSIFGLALTLVTFICFKQLRKKIPSKILICLCLSLMALLLVFVAGVNQTSDSGLCHLVAVLLQYFTLTTFCWMSVEAVNLYRTVVKVFSRGDDGTFFRWMFVCSWGIPAIIASVSGFLDRRHFFKHDDDIHTSLCIVIGTQFYFALLTPTCLLLLFNFALFVPILRGISGGEKIFQDSIHDKQKMIARRTKSSFAVLALLGLGWIFAILALGKLKIVFQWLFCICTTFQGFFIFLMFVIFNHDARKAWRHLCSFDNSSPNSGSYTNNYKTNDATTTETSIIIKSEHDDRTAEESMELKSFAQDE